MIMFNVTMCNKRHKRRNVTWVTIRILVNTHLLFFQKKAKLQFIVKVSKNASMKILRMIRSQTK